MFGMMVVAVAYPKPSARDGRQLADSTFLVHDDCTTA
jgi:hypothetical protein